MKRSRHSGNIAFEVANSIKYILSAIKSMYNLCTIPFYGTNIEYEKKIAVVVTGFDSINRNSSHVPKYYSLLLDGDIQNLLISNDTGSFLIGYQLLVSKGVITPT